MAQEKAPETSILYLAVRSSGVSAILAAGRLNFRRGIELLRRWLAYSDAPGWQTHFYRDMAEWASGTRRFDMALEWIAKANETAARTDDFYARRAAKHIHRHILVENGRFKEALPLLPGDEHPDPYQRYYETWQWVRLLLGLGERSEAHDRLNRLLAIIREYGLPPDSADDLIQMF
jgi:hypothetical protein